MTDDAATTTDGATGDGGDATQDTTTAITTDAGSVNVSTEKTAGAPDAATIADAGSVKTALDSDKTADKTADDVKPYWNDDWRERMAGENKKELETLSRFTSPEALYKAHRELQDKMAKTSTRRELPENPTEKELASYREGIGVPKTPEDYDTSLSDGLVIGDDDKPAIDNFLKVAHENNMTTDQAKNALEWYYKDMETQLSARQAVDDEKAEATRKELKEEWGGAFDKNINIMKGYFGEEKWEKLSEARLSDGTPIMSDKDLINFFAEAGRKANPTATLVGGGGGAPDPAKNIKSELADIKVMMNTPGSDYYQPAKKQEIQDRYVALEEALETMEKK